MKKLYFLLLFVSFGMIAQVPQGFSYQAVALNTAGQPVASSTVSIRVSILEGSANGTSAYTEVHHPMTNNLGLFTLTIGQGTPQTGTFAGVNWATNSKFLKVEMDVANGANYITVGSSQLLSVPYAMYAGAVAGFGTSSGSNQFTQLYLYGTFNSFNAATALSMVNGGSGFIGYKYLTAGTQLKFITALNSTAAYGNGGSNVLALNGNAFNINSNGIYNISISENDMGVGQYEYYVNISSIGFEISPNFGSDVPMAYNAGTNTLSASLTVPAGTPSTDRKFYFSVDGGYFGDNLANGSIESGGQIINLPATGTNFLVTLNFNFTGDGSPYTITPQ